VHKRGNLSVHAPKKLYDEISAAYADMICDETAKEVEAKRKAFLRNGGCAAARSPTAWKRRAKNSSPSCGSQATNGSPSDPRMRSTSPRTLGLVFLSGTGDRVAKSGARGCKLRRAAAIVAPPLRRPCAVPVVGRFAIGRRNVRRRVQPAVPPRFLARAIL
jgi:hypothetical protein